MTSSMQQRAAENERREAAQPGLRTDGSKICISSVEYTKQARTQADSQLFERTAHTSAQPPHNSTLPMPVAQVPETIEWLNAVAEKGEAGMLVLADDLAKWLHGIHSPESVEENKKMLPKFFKAWGITRTKYLVDLEDNVEGTQSALETTCEEDIKAAAKMWAVGLSEDLRNITAASARTPGLCEVCVETAPLALSRRLGGQRRLTPA